MYVCMYRKRKKITKHVEIWYLYKFDLVYCTYYLCTYYQTAYYIPKYFLKFCVILHWYTVGGVPQSCQSQEDSEVELINSKAAADPFFLPSRTITMKFLYACHLVLNLPSQVRNKVPVQRDYVAHVFNGGTIFSPGIDVNSELK